MKISYHHGYDSGFIHKDKKPIPVYCRITDLLAVFYKYIGDARPIVVLANLKPLSLNREN